jgi:hypothetical protein
VVYVEDNDDSTRAKELKEKGYTLPEYHFIAEYNGTESKPGPVMEVRGWVKKRLLNTETKEIYRNRKYILYLPDGGEFHGTTDDNGYMETTITPISQPSVKLDE